MYKIDELVEKAGGKDYIKHLVEKEGYSQKDIAKILGISATTRSVYKKCLDFCKATIPHPKISQLSRKWMIRWATYGYKYWEDEFLVEQLLIKLKSPILNTAGKSKRYNISVWGHPKANKDSHQIRAHQIVWELANKCFLPDGMEVEALDGNYLNLDITNLKARTTLTRKSFYSTGDRNHFYTGVQKYVRYTRGWVRKSRVYRNKIAYCEICKNKENLNAHHIINYWLFDKSDFRVHDENNLLCVCDSCHGNIHQHNTSIEPHISETKYKNLLELLGSLKSQVPESLVETYKGVEKQLGLTDNQQPST